MIKYVKVIDGTKSHANGFEYKIGKINISNKWNPNANNPDDFGGFNFSTEDKILRFLHRGTIIYDVEIPDDAETVEVENVNAPNGVFRTNKIIVSNPKPITEKVVIDLYKKSNLPEKTYYQCLVTLLFKKHVAAVKYIIKDRINKNNIDEAIYEFESFIMSVNNSKFNYEELWKEAKEIYNILKEIEKSK